jgi:hypothetical protein
MSPLNFSAPLRKRGMKDLFTTILLVGWFAFIYFFISSNRLRYDIIRQDRRRAKTSDYVQDNVMVSDKPSIVFEPMFR